jgi:hypothetical protein
VPFVDHTDARKATELVGDPVLRAAESRSYGRRVYVTAG